jgi:TM2 domain-containing membrane protein YozV
MLLLQSLLWYTLYQEDTGMLKTKTAAVLLAFFFVGDCGAHWFYLGEPERGWFYPLGYLLSFLVGVLGGSTFGWIGGLMLIGVIGCRIYDFFYLLCMHPSDFDARYNNG